MVCPVQALTAELPLGFDADIVMCGLCSLTAQQLTSIVGERHVYVGCGRVRQELGHSLKEYGPLDLVIIMTRINYLGVTAHPMTTTHDVLTLFVTCHRAGVRTVFHPLPPKSGTKRGRSEMPLVRVPMGESHDDAGAEILVRRWSWQLDG